MFVDHVAGNGTVDDANDYVDAVSVVDVPWPSPMSRAAYVGIVGEIVDALAPQTEADPAALLIQLLAMFGNVSGRTAHWRVEADTHHLNLYAVLVGKTARGRKGVSEGQARRFFESVDPAWTTTCQASGLSTGEGLIAHIRDPVPKQQPVRDEDKKIVRYETVIEDPGVTDKRLYVVEAEFASTLKVMMREGNTLSPVLRNAWDGKTLQTLTKASPLRATGPHVTIIGSITEAEVRRYLTATECANGFGNRFLWVCVKRSRLLPFGGDVGPIDRWVGRLRALVDEARTVRAIGFDADAYKLWGEIYHWVTADRPGLLGSLTARADPLVRRLACLYALGDGSHVVRISHLEAALEVWRYCFDSAAYIFGDSLGDTQADRFMAALKAAGGIGLTRSEVITDVFHNHISSSELRRIEAIVQGAGVAVCRQEDSRGGRPAARWFYVSRERSERSEESPAAGPQQGTSFASFAGSQAEAETSSASSARSDHSETDQAASTDSSAEFTLEPVNGTPLPAVEPAIEEFDL